MADDEPSQPRPRSTRRRSVALRGMFLLIGVAFLSFVACLAFPGLRRLTAPIVCQSGYTGSALVAKHWGRVVRFDLYCLDGEGLPLATRPGIVWLAFAGELLALVLALRVLLSLWASTKPRAVE